jgi:hypothetical protein
MEGKISAGGIIGEAIKWKYGVYHVTLVHTRFPLDEFIYDPAAGENIDDIDDLNAEERAALYRTAGGGARPRISGHWGTMMMIVGPRITYASFTPRVPHWRGGERSDELQFVGRTLHLCMMGQEPIFSTKLFTTVERYRTDAGHLNEWGFGYVRMLSRNEPYGLRNETGNPVVRKYLKRGNGACIRVLGGATLQQQAILIHDAPHVGFVIGCIGPRPWNDRRPYDNVANNPSDLAVQEIMGQLAKARGQGSLFVLRS